MKKDNEGRIYLCIDLKSFFASVECVERGLDPFRDNLVVADPDRKEATICLAVTPAMKALGVRNRCRVFEIPKHISYVMAKPRMRLYMQKSAQIYSVYLRYISPEDIHVYSIDECFMDITDYLKLYSKAPRELAQMLMEAVMEETGIASSVGIGTNLFLAKIALDITAKHSPERIGVLDVERFQRTLWEHRPLTDFWNIGPGIAKRLAKYGIFDLKGVVNSDPATLYREFGVNAELLIDHAHGVEPCTIADIHAYRPRTTSLTTGQVLFRDYQTEEARLVLREMAEGMALELIRREQVTDSISLAVGYSKNAAPFTGGSLRLSGYTNSAKKLIKAFDSYFEQTVRSQYLIRRINVGVHRLVGAEYTTVDLFTDQAAEQKEQALLQTVVRIRDRYGSNSILKAMNLQAAATARERNLLIGGHNGE